MVLGALTGLIPKIEGFAPLPSAAADAFMSMQGGHMALYFGAEYTIGKRLIASMSNEEFNKAVKTPKLFIHRIEPHYQKITLAFEAHLKKDIARIQELVMDKAYDVEILKIHQNVKLLKELPAAYWEAIWSTNDKINQGLDAPSTGGKSPGQPDPRGGKDSHAKSHNSILSRYSHQRNLEADLVLKHKGYLKAKDNPRITKSHLVRIKANVDLLKVRLLAYTKGTHTLQRAHQAKHGHQVTPFSDRI